MKTPAKKIANCLPWASPRCSLAGNDPRAVARWIPTASSTLKVVPPDLRQRVLARVDELIAIARRCFDVPFAAPAVYFNVRGTVGGYAQHYSWSIQLNPALLLENEAQYLQNIIPHEIAHLIAVNAFGPKTGHGPHFRAVMLSLGARPSRTHSMDTSSAIAHLPLFRYRCGCQVRELKARAHNAIVRGAASYSCKLCTSPLLFTGEWRRNGTWTKDPLPAVAPLKPRPQAKNRR